ncbi:hypothetical protein ABZ904_38650 [Streptomyces sp. NPDC046900]|uniref:hypothetical protein n=1 Tax=Streptomyces sp. NPDC046900 TaxID=3155473 RepID=UPI0033F99FB0
MTGGVDARAAAGEFDRGSVTEDERKQVLSLFPLEDWGTLLLERYAPPGCAGIPSSPGSYSC